ncbi:MAG: LysE family translocator [Lutibacter sp.]
MINYEILISFIGASMLLTFMPGPDIIYVLAQSIINGKKYGIVTALGLVSGIIIHTSLVAFGLAAILKHNPNLFYTIKIFGASYLFYLAYKSYKTSSEIELSENLTKISLAKLYQRGFIMNVINPKVSIFFLAFFPGFLFSNEIAITVQFYVLGLLFMIQALIIFIVVSYLANYMSNYLKTHRNFTNRSKWVQVFIFISIGIFILFT